MEILQQQLEKGVECLCGVWYRYAVVARVEAFEEVRDILAKLCLQLDERLGCFSGTLLRSRGRGGGGGLVA